MKKLILSVCAIAVVAAIGCKSGGASGNDPKATLMAFFKALSKKDIAGAKKLATKESESMLSMMEMGMNMAEKMKSKESDDEFKKFEEGNLEFGEAKIEGDKATIPVKNKVEEETMNFILKKEGGAWKVAFDKNSMAEMAGERMKNEGNDENFNMDSLNNAMKNIDADSLKRAIQQGLGALDSLKDIMKDLPK